MCILNGTHFCYITINKYIIISKYKLLYIILSIKYCNYFISVIHFLINDHSIR